MNNSISSELVAADGTTAVLIQPGTFGDYTNSQLSIIQGTLLAEPSQGLSIMSKVLQIEVPSSNITKPLAVVLQASSTISSRRRRRMLLSTADEYIIIKVHCHVFCFFLQACKPKQAAIDIMNETSRYFGLISQPWFGEPSKIPTTMKHPGQPLHQ